MAFWGFVLAVAALTVATAAAAAAAEGSTTETSMASSRAILNPGSGYNPEGTAASDTSSNGTHLLATPTTAPGDSEVFNETKLPETTSAIASPPLLLNKCCKSFERLDHNQRECVPMENITKQDLIQEDMETLRARGPPWWSYSKLWTSLKKARSDAVVRYGWQACDRELASLKWSKEATFYSNGSLEIKLWSSGNFKKKEFITLSPEDYCVDKTNIGGKFFFVYLTCPCRRVPCIRKCCDYSRMLTLHPSVALSRNADCNILLNKNQTWNITLFSDAKERRVSNVSFALLRGPFASKCGTGRTLVSLDSKDIRMADIVLLSNGSLVGKVSGSPFSPQEYCVDITKSPTGVERLWALACAKVAPPRPMSALDKVYVALYFAGILSLAATLTVYALLPSLRRPANAKALLCHTAALAVALLTLSVSRFVTQVQSYAYCASLAFVAQFFLLATFCWLSVLCFDIARAFRTSLRPADCSAGAACRRLWAYSAFAWGSPAIIVAISAFLNFAPGLALEVLRPDIGQQGCWFKRGNSVLAYYYGPVAFLLLVNVTMFSFTMMRLRIAQQEMAHLKNEEGQLSGGALRRRRERLLLYAKLFSLMGVTWVLEVVAWAAGADWVTVLVIDTVNVLRGVGVFATTCCKREVLSALRGRLADLSPCVERPPARGRERGLSYTVSSTLATSTPEALRMRRMANELGH